MCYPHDTSSSSNQSDQYAPVIVPCDLVHVRLGVSPPPGIVVTIHAIPPQFPLTLTYIETLVSQKYNFEHRQMTEQRPIEGEPCGSFSSVKDPGATSPWRNFETVVIPPPVLLHVSELLGSYLWRTDIPAQTKEYVFHLMAQCLRMLHHSETHMTSAQTLLPPVSPQLSPSLALLMQLQSELRKLYDDETKSWSTESTPSGTGMGLGVGDSGRFTTYFHALMEVSLGVAEVTAPITSGSMVSLTAIETTPSTGGGGTTQSVPTSPMSAGKRKKLKAKRDRGTTTPKRSGSPRRLSESDAFGTSPPASGSLSGSSVSSGGTASASSSSSSVALSGGKPEDMLWFHRALTLSQILRHLVYGDLQGQGVTNDAIADAAQSLTTPTAPSRLLIITCIPVQLDEQLITAAIRKACNANGGLFLEEIYIPTEVIETQISEESTDSETAEAQTLTTKQVPTKKQPSPKTEAAASDPLSQQPEGKKKTIKTKRIKGYAVVELRSRTKIEAVRKALFRSKTLIDSLTLGAENLVDIQEEMLTISTVNQNLMADPHNNASTALDNYCLDKVISRREGGADELTDAMMIALTEIFHSCFISEQKLSLVETKQESGYICLSRDQISMQVPGNLLFAFLTAIRAPKKTFSEQVLYILRRYGILKLVDKEE